MFKFLYSIVLVAVIGGLIYAGFFWYNRGEKELTLDLQGPKEVLVGVPFKLKIKINNDSRQVLQDARLSLNVPDGVVFVGESLRENLLSRKIGNLGIGNLTSEDFELMVVEGESGTVKKIAVEISYSPEFLGSRFNKEEEWQFTIGGSAVRLDVRAPDQVSSGEELKLQISYQNVSDVDLENLSLKIEYPKAFQYQKSTMIPDEDNNQWDLGGLRRGSSNDFTVIGKLVGLENTFFEFKIKIYANLKGESYLVGETAANTSIKMTPLSLEILANNVSDYTVNLGERIKYSINYNYLDSAANKQKSAVIKVRLSGKMFNLNSLQGANIVGDTITWNLANLPSSGSVSFTISAKENYPIKRLGDRNFILSVEAEMDDGQYVSVARSESKVSGSVVVEAQAFFRDAAASIINRGPFPPVVGEPTEYSIHWLVSNYATDVRDVVVKAALRPGVKFIGSSKSSNNNKPFYNPKNNEVVWEVGRISATKGVISKPLEAVFQVRAIPEINMAGKFMPLIGKTNIKAVDQFTGFPLVGSASVLTTELSADKTLQKEGKVVVGLPL